MMSHIAVPTEIAEVLPAIPDQARIEAPLLSPMGEKRPEKSPGSPHADPRKLLMITSIAGAGNCAASLGGQLKMMVEVVGSRREGFLALRGQEYAAIILDDALADSDPQGAEMLRKYAGAAVLLEVNFAISGVARLARQVRGELQRREQENSLAMRLACAALASELKETVAGLLLQSQLALGDPGVSPQLSIKLHQVVQLAGSLRKRLDLPVQRA
jgi:hypothetical protein